MATSTSIAQIGSTAANRRGQALSATSRPDVSSHAPLSGLSPTVKIPGQAFPQTGRSTLVSPPSRSSKDSGDARSVKQAEYCKPIVLYGSVSRRAMGKRLALRTEQCLFVLIWKRYSPVRVKPDCVGRAYL